MTEETGEGGLDASSEPPIRRDRRSYIRELATRIPLIDKLRFRSEAQKNPDFFIPNAERARKYLHLDRSRKTSWPDAEIPLGENETMRYHGFEAAEVNHSPISDYQKALFPDEFSNEPPEDFLAEAERKDNPDPESIFGGYEEAFAEGKTVLDLGSGQAVGLLQLAQRFLKTSFIGIDKHYKRKLPIFPERPGLQLTHGDWRELGNIADKSVDTIMSHAGIGVWGVMGGKSTKDYYPMTPEDGDRTIATLNRIAKPGAIARIGFHGTEAALEKFREKMQDTWEIDTSQPGLFIGRKRQA